MNKLHHSFFAKLYPRFEFQYRRAKELREFLSDPNITSSSCKMIRTMLGFTVFEKSFCYGCNGVFLFSL